jgi:hypothetical protein
MPPLMAMVMTMLMVSLLASCIESPTKGNQSEPMTLVFEPPAVALTGTRTPEGGLRCPVDLTIRASGRTDHRLSLKSISAAFTVNGVTNSPATIEPSLWFNMTSLGNDATATTRRQPTAAGPFIFVTTLTYEDQFGTQKTATSTVTCNE